MLNKRNMNHSLLLQAGFPWIQPPKNKPCLKTILIRTSRLKDGDKEMAMMEAVERRYNEDRRSVAASMLVEWASDGEPTWLDFSALAISWLTCPIWKMTTPTIPTNRLMLTTMLCLIWHTPPLHLAQTRKTSPV